MARKRVIDTEIYFDSELCNTLKDRGLHLYIRLWGIADDAGVYDPNYKNISLLMGALKTTCKQAESYIGILKKTGKVIEYTAEDGKKYHWLKNFLKHQPLNNPGLPKYPLPEWIFCEIKEFKSGKKYAKYSVITSKLPVGYQYTTSNVETKRNETETETETETKQKYGEFQNVLLTDSQVEKLKAKLNGKYEDWIKTLDEGIELKGYKYKSHYLAILKWHEKDKKGDPFDLSNGL